MTGQDDSVPSSTSVGAALLVVYTEQLEACRDFYCKLGLPLVQEQHGSGPVHYAAELVGGLVVELYPGKPERTTGRLRLGFTVPATVDRPAGHHQLTDPDGRAVELRSVDLSEEDEDGAEALDLDDEELVVKGPDGPVSQAFIDGAHADEFAGEIVKGGLGERSTTLRPR